VVPQSGYGRLKEFSGQPKESSTGNVCCFGAHTREPRSIREGCNRESSATIREVHHSNPDFRRPDRNRIQYARVFDRQTPLRERPLRRASGARRCPSLGARPILYSKCRIARYQRCSTILANREFMARPTLADGQVPVLLTPKNGTCPPFLFRQSASPRICSRCANCVTRRPAFSHQTNIVVQNPAGLRPATTNLPRSNSSSQFGQGSTSITSKLSTQNGKEFRCSSTRNEAPRHSPTRFKV
jgi:hypothetical protein